MKSKKEAKDTKTKVAKEDEQIETLDKLASKGDLKSFLLGIRDRLGEQTLAPIYALSAMRYVMSQPNVYDWLDNENKELARDIWLRLKQVGMQVRNPPLLFSPEEDGVVPRAE